MKRLSLRKSAYWSDVCVSCAQVFLAVSAATFFAGKLDFVEGFVIFVNIIIAMLFWIIGWRISI